MKKLCPGELVAGCSGSVAMWDNADCGSRTEQSHTGFLENNDVAIVLQVRRTTRRHLHETVADAVLIMTCTGTIGWIAYDWWVKRL